MLSQALIVVSAVVLFALGLMHLVFTFWSTKFEPREAGLREEMDRSAILLTSRTTVWKAWIGFNASHSMGPILFGLVYGYLSVFFPKVLFGSWFLLGLGFVTLVGYLLLAGKYWFRAPFLGILLSLLTYGAALLTLLR